MRLAGVLGLLASTVGYFSPVAAFAQSSSAEAEARPDGVAHPLPQWVPNGATTASPWRAGGPDELWYLARYDVLPFERGKDCPGDGYRVVASVAYRMQSDGNLAIHLTSPIEVHRVSRCGDRQHPVPAAHKDLVRRLAPDLWNLTSIEARRLSPPAVCVDPRLAIRASPTVEHLWKDGAHRFFSRGEPAVIELLVGDTVVGRWDLGTTLIEDPCEKGQTVTLPWHLRLDIACKDNQAAVGALTWRREPCWKCFQGCVVPAESGPPLTVGTANGGGGGYVSRADEERLAIDLSRAVARRIQIPSPRFEVDK